MIFWGFERATKQIPHLSGVEKHHPKLRGSPWKIWNGENSPRKLTARTWKMMGLEDGPFLLKWSRFRGTFVHFRRGTFWKTLFSRANFSFREGIVCFFSTSVLQTLIFTLFRGLTARSLRQVLLLGASGHLKLLQATSFRKPTKYSLQSAAALRSLLEG